MALLVRFVGTHDRRLSPYGLRSTESHLIFSHTLLHGRLTDVGRVHNRMGQPSQGPPSMMLPTTVAEGATLSIVRPPRNTEPENKPPNNAKSGTPVNTPCPRLENSSLLNAEAD